MKRAPEELTEEKIITIPNEVITLILLSHQTQPDQILTLEEYRNLTNISSLNKSYWFPFVLEYMANRISYVSEEILNKRDDAFLLQFEKLRKISLPLLDPLNPGQRTIDRFYGYLYHNHALGFSEDKLPESMSREGLKKRFPDYRRVSEEMFQNFTTLRELTIDHSDPFPIFNGYWKYLSNLTTLKYVCTDIYVCDYSPKLNGLNSLKSLTMQFPSGHNFDSVVDGLTSLTELRFNSDILSDEAVGRMTQLQILHTSWNSSSLKGQTISKLPHLKKLVLSCDTLDDSHLSALTNLEHLVLANALITDQSLSRLEKLKILSISPCSHLKGASFPYLTNVTHLQLSKMSNQFQNSSLDSMRQLKYLELMENESITSEGLTNLTNLETLGLWGDELIDGKNFQNLTSLRHLFMYEKCNFSLTNLSNMKHLSTAYMELDDVCDEERDDFCKQNGIDMSGGRQDYDFDNACFFDYSQNDGVFW